MKSIPEHIDGPRGEWFKKVNTLIQKAMECNDTISLTNILGQPDFIEYVEDSDRISDETGEIDTRYAEEYWNYKDPFRPKRIYRFAISNGYIVESSRVSKST